MHDGCNHAREDELMPPNPSTEACTKYVRGTSAETKAL